MRIGNRIFPYPVLNANPDLTNYLESSKFGFEFETTEDGSIIMENGKIVLRQVHFFLENSQLNELYKAGSIRAAMIIECSSSTYRKCFEIFLEPIDLIIDAQDLNGMVSVSVYLYANEDITRYNNEEFNEIYQDYKFDLDKFDILAVDDGGRFRINIDPTEDDRVSSIFTIVKVENENQIISYEIRKRQIVIQLPRIYYEQYDKIKRRKENNNISFAILAIPTLSACLSELQQRYNSIDEIIDSYLWFESVKISYEQLTGNELDIETFDSEQPFKLAQILLNQATCRGIEDFGMMISGENEEGGEEDE